MVARWPAIRDREAAWDAICAQFSCDKPFSTLDAILCAWPQTKQNNYHHRGLQIHAMFEEVARDTAGYKHPHVIRLQDTVATSKWAREQWMLPSAAPGDDDFQEEPIDGQG